MTKMKKLYLCMFLVFVFSQIVLAQSSLPECKGNDENISKYTRKHFAKMRKWTNCHGTAISPKGHKYIGEFYDGKFHGHALLQVAQVSQANGFGLAAGGFLAERI